MVSSSDGLDSETGSVADGLPECSYSTAALEETASPPPTVETDARVSILNMTAFAQAQVLMQPDTTSYAIDTVSPTTIIPGAASGDATFYATSVGTAAQGHITWTYLYVQVNGNVYFRVGVVDPSGSTSQREATAVAAALDVLRNLTLLS